MNLDSDELFRSAADAQTIKMLSESIAQLRTMLQDEREAHAKTAETLKETRDTLQCAVQVLCVRWGGTWPQFAPGRNSNFLS